MDQIQKLRSALAQERFVQALIRIDAKHPWLAQVKTLNELKETK